MPSSRSSRLSRSKAWRRAACSVGIAGYLVRDGVERQRLVGVEQHEHQIGDALQPVELRGGLHRPEPTAGADRVTAAGHPFDWHLHLFWLLALPALVAVYLGATRREGYGATARQRLLFLGGAVLLLAAVTWPLGDLASHWLLLALVLQRLLLTLAVPPLLVLGTPRPIIARLTRPPAVDAVLRVVVRPLPAVAIVTVVAVATLTTGAVGLAARSDAARVVLELVVLASGFVLWAPVLTELPGDAAPLARSGAVATSSCSRSCPASSPSSGSSPGTRCTPPSPTRAPWPACRPSSTRSWPASWPS